MVAGVEALWQCRARHALLSRTLEWWGWHGATRCGGFQQARICRPHWGRQLMDDSLSQTAEACPLIEHLILSSCLSIDVRGLSSLHCLQKLALLDLSYTFLMNLKPVFDSCLQLKTAIEELLACCTNLVNVNLNGCTNLHELVCGSDYCRSGDMPVDAFPPDSAPDKTKEIRESSDCQLEVLNCTGCPNIKKVVIPSTANYLNLSKINLNLSANLKEVDLKCSNLYNLNLSNCNSLEILKLDCPRLANLQLLACTMLQEDELKSALSFCGALEILNVHSCPQINTLDFGRLQAVCPTLKRIQSSLIA
ncbi:hypothetical protein TRIUR3_24741 [Triticum urartu]|uniref:F-box/LRR-repeat protein 15 n=1 Tax=Triticum urartu TaxID=4572 RepID=M7YH58_TRIUA|nr:hypothetical protein TRIUR3_24741 [Triticum urartu]